MPVIENLKVPTRGIILIMLAFIVVIGPVNMIYLSRRNRRTWMLWTIPAISLVTTLLVFVYSLVREGITPDTAHCRRYAARPDQSPRRDHRRRGVLLSTDTQRRVEVRL